MTHASVSRAGPSPNFRWGILAFLMALCFLSHFNRASITSAGDERIMKQFAISPEKMGMIYSAFLVVYTIFMIPGGWFIDRRGPRLALAVMGVGSALFSVFTGAVGFGFLAAGQIWISLLLVRSLMGLLNTPLHPASARSVSEWFPPTQQSLANGLITGASIFAYALVHPVFGALIDWVEWPRAFVITGAFTALLASAWFFFARDNSPQSLPAAHSAGPALLFRNRPLLMLTLSYAAVGYFQYVFFYWLHYYFDSVLKMEKADSRFFAGLPNLAMAFCMPVGGWISGVVQAKLGRVSIVPKAGMTLSALLLLLGIFSASQPWIVFWFTASLGVLGLCEASFWTTAVRLGGTQGGTAAAIMNTGGNGIGLLAPILTPFIGARLGWGWGIGAGALIGIAGALCWLGVEPKKKPLL